MQPHLLALAGISLAQAIAMVSPGPAVLLVSRVAAGQSRAAAVRTGAGVASAASIWAIGAVLGVSFLLARLPALAAVIQLAGAAYLIFLGLTAWREASDATHQPPMHHGATPAAPFRRGLLLSLGNPKIALFYGGIFVSLIPANAPVWLIGAALAIVIAQEFVWYAVVVSTVFSRPPVQRAYGRVRARIERAMGVVFITLGARIAALAHL